MLKQLAFVLPDGKVSACEQLYWHPQFIIGDLKKRKRLRVYTIVDFSFIRTFAPSF